MNYLDGQKCPSGLCLDCAMTCALNIVPLWFFAKISSWICFKSDIQAPVTPVCVLFTVLSLSIGLVLILGLFRNYWLKT